MNLVCIISEVVNILYQLQLQLTHLWRCWSWEQKTDHEPGRTSWFWCWL